MGRRFRRFLILVVSFLVSLTPSVTFAKSGITSNQLREFSQNNILYYDPSECIDGGSGVAPTGDRITWIGDSYSVGAKKIIEEKFPGISFGGSVENSGSYIQSNKGVSDRYGGGEANPPALTILKRIVDAKELKPYLVMAVGTNAGWTDEEVNDFKAIMSSSPDTKVIFVTAKAKAHLASDDNGTNVRLKTLAESNDNYYLADWAANYDAKYYAENDTHPTAHGGYEKWVDTIYNAIPASSYGGSEEATGNFDKILTAKNADKTFFNGSGEVPSASWADNNPESMKRLLETYGDLAYQLGDAVGAPYIAILVQMRYEDPNSVCGKNNFWGNGCPPGTGAGGASIQGSNLGEGFAQYGKTLLNGYHDQAIGVSDPKAYLEAIGPTWVQGNINGPGYGSIEAMKKSVDALQAYADSAEGQKIVTQFGNYHGSAGGNFCSVVFGGGGGDINATAIQLAWPANEYGKHGWNDPSKAYAKALSDTGVNKLGDACSMAGGSCDAFVATVMRFSGADPDFRCCGVSNGNVLNYIKTSGKYEEVLNKLGSLQPGDIRIGPHHIELYVEVNGEPHIAAASHCERSGDVGSYYNNSFTAYRLRR